jgi:uncharacterized membrane protein
MELLTLLFLVGLVVLLASNNSLKQRIEALERRVGTDAAVPPQLQTQPPDAPPLQDAPAVATVAAPPPEEAVPAVPLQAEPPPTIIDLAPEPAPERESVGILFERLIAGKLLIWLGGIALVVAAIFLIRYSIEIGLVTPTTRMAGAAIFGLILLGLGEYARIGRLLADDPRIAQALVGAGIAVLYATAYGSHILYGLIGAAAASGAMLAITGLALALSLRHGAPTAVMGLAGGFLTPLLVGDPDAGAVPLLGYLGLLDLAIFLIAWRRGWTWLAAAAVLLSFVWSAYLLAQPKEDALASGAFIVLLAIAASLVRPGDGRALGLIQPMILGIVQLAILVARTDLDGPAWILFGALAAASIALAALRDEYRLAPPITLALALALLAAKAATRDSPYVAEAAIGITLLFGVAGLGLAFWRGRLLWTATACLGFAAPTLILRALRPELLERPAWGAMLAALTLGPVVLAWRNRGSASAKMPADLALLACGATAALLAGAALWDLLPRELIVAGWLGVALALAFAARRLDDLALAIVAAVAATVAVARAIALVPELALAGASALVGEPVLAFDLPSARTALFALALPALLLVGMHQLAPPLPRDARRAVLPVAGLLGIAALYLWFKQAYGLASSEDFAARGFLERIILTQALFAAGWLLGSGRLSLPRVEPGLAAIAGTALTALAALRLLWFDIIVHNPAWETQWVGPAPVLNLILPQFLLGALWLYAARRRADAATRSGFWLAAFLAVLIAGTMLLVRQAFHGAILTGPDMPIAEFYGYSLAALLLSIALLIAGIRLPDKALRLAGLILLTATILKVFLVDASELEGLLRILSFLGLGIALIGIGRLYGPVLRAERPAG